MKQVLVRQGEILVEEVAPPQVERGTVLVRVAASCISVGTEMSGVASSGIPLWKKALAQPAKIKRVVDMVATQGLGRTVDFVRGQVGAEIPIGYSAAGTVIAVGDDIADMKIGDRVACGGAQNAYHAEIIRVPRNLCAPVPDGVGWDEASTVTLGAIALQGVRRLAPTLGECFVVVGLGLLGQFAVQLLKAGGCRVIGIDPDAKRADLALSLGMDAVVDSASGDSAETVMRLTQGVGADGVIVTASSGAAADLLNQALRLCRRKGRVVLVGDVPITMDRSEIYAKELDFLISTSYGPGRYDKRYEEEGADYPIAYVRWTENRNMAAWLDMLAAKRVTVAPLVGARHGLDDAPAAYGALKGTDRPLMVLLDYPDRPAAAIARIPNPKAPALKAGALGIAVVGSGAFAKAMHLPNLKALGDQVGLRAVVGRSGHNARTLAAQFGADYSTTDVAQVLDDDQVDAILIATRHDSHGKMVLQALQAGKHVFVEKPLALTKDELTGIEAFYAAHPDGPVLTTGFNRRASPFVRRIVELTANRAAPMMITYRMNAGHLPADHWTHGPEGGGRNRGEACHIYDLFTALTGAACTGSQTMAIRTAGGHDRGDDNFTASFQFADGSVATLTYTALGAREYPKERMEVFSDGRVLSLDDYYRLTVEGAKAKGLETKTQDKGHAALLTDFVKAAQGRAPWPIPLWNQVQATDMALAVEAALHPERGA